MSQRTCSVDVCDREHYGRGYCVSHYEWGRRRDWREEPTHKVGAARSEVGDTYVDSKGYVVEKIPADSPFRPMARGTGYKHRWIKQHRYVVAKSLGRVLDSSESVHHINGDKSDNRLENLQLRQSRGHGPGAAFVCGDCGSQNVVAEPLA